MSNELPLLTADMPGVGGQIKCEIDDFEVEEIPAYEPQGDGPHLYLWIEKRDVGAEFLSRELGKRLDVPPRDIGMSGMKDRRALTRQWISVPENAQSRLPQFDHSNIRILKTSRHQNKLKPGHLRGNRFRVLIRNVAADAASVAEPILERIRRDGLPNFYGTQRFGRDGDNAEMGLKQLRGERVGRLNPFLRKLTLSAAQSLLFNDYLARRMSDGLMRQVLPGDALGKWPAGGMFTTTDPATDQIRLDSREIVPLGPIFGKKTYPCQDEAAIREAAVLTSYSLDATSFSGGKGLLDGTRRHNFVYVDDLQCKTESHGLRLDFSLPAGSYATVLLREVMKNSVDAA